MYSIKRVTLCGSFLFPFYSKRELIIKLEVYLKVVTNNMHPLESEYFKIADIIYCAIKYAVSLEY